MTDASFFSPRLLSMPFDHQSTLLPASRSPRPGTFKPGPFVPMLPAEDQVSRAMLIGMVAVTLPAAVYSLLQVWQLVGGGTLHQAIRAFLP